MLQFWWQDWRIWGILQTLHCEAGGVVAVLLYSEGFVLLMCSKLEAHSRAVHNPDRSEYPAGVYFLMTCRNISLISVYDTGITQRPED